MLRYFTLLLTLVVSSTPTVAAAHAGKPPKNPTPPVTYMVKTFRMPVAPEIVNVYQMTSSGVVVGSYTPANEAYGSWHPFIYEPSVDPDFASDLNDDFDIILDETDKSLRDEGLQINSALDINAYGFVVGSIEETQSPGVRRGYLLDLNSDPPRLYLLPDAGLGDTTLDASTTTWTSRECSPSTRSWMAAPIFTTRYSIIRSTLLVGLLRFTSN